MNSNQWKRKSCVILLYFSLVLASCATGTEFIIPDGKNISQVNSESYVYCASGAKKDRKYIAIVGPHPYIDSIQIYKHTIFDGRLSDEDLALFKSRRCAEPIYFLNEKSISNIKVKELEFSISNDQKNQIINDRRKKEERKILEDSEIAADEKLQFERLTVYELGIMRDEIYSRKKHKEKIQDKNGNWVTHSDDLPLDAEIERIERRITQLSYEEKLRKERQYDNEFRLRRESELATDKAREQNRQQLRERCLSNNLIGICISVVKDKVDYINLCGDNALTMSDTRGCYAKLTDAFSIIAYLEVRNNSKVSIKDIKFNCAQISKSGTTLLSENHTVYDLWKPGELKFISIKFPKHQQVETMTCKAVVWK